MGLLRANVLSLALQLVPGSTLGVDNGVGLRPPMGWRNWNSMGGNVDQTKMEQAMEKMAERKRAVVGLDGGPRSYVDLGYNRAGLDDGARGKPSLLLSPSVAIAVAPAVICVMRFHRRASARRRVGRRFRSLASSLSLAA
jgi:hypothetical protein